MNSSNQHANQYLVRGWTDAQETTMRAGRMIPPPFLEIMATGVKHEGGDPVRDAMMNAWNGSEKDKVRSCVMFHVCHRDNDGVEGTFLPEDMENR